MVNITGQQYIRLKKALRTNNYTLAHGVLATLLSQKLGKDISKLTDKEAVKWVLENISVELHIHETINWYGRHNIPGLKAKNSKYWVH